MNIRQIAYDYLQDYSPFTQFSGTHWAALAFFAALILVLPNWAKKKLSEPHQQLLGHSIGVVIVMSYVTWAALELLAGTFELNYHLPFHLCRFTNIIIFLVMTYRSPFWFNILYLWVFTGVLQASFSPDLKQDFPHFLYFRYFLGHPAMILAMVYATVVYGMRPTLRGFFHGIIATNVYAAFTLILNVSINANYFFTLRKPETASALDVMGPWPWYLVSCNVLLATQGFLFFLPFVWKDLKKVFKKA